MKKAGATVIDPLTDPPVREALQAKGISPDFTYRSAKPDALIDYIHRTTDDAEIYYVANRNERPEYLHLSFRVEGKTPELWRPETGEIIDWPVYNSTDGQTLLPLFLEPFGSVFVVFRKPATAHYESIALNDKNLFPELPQDTFDIQPVILQKDGNPVFMLAGTYTLLSSDSKTRTFDAVTENIPVTSAWDVSFDPAWGGPEKVRFEKLVLWNEHTDPGIRYYSGAAGYKTTVELEARQYQHKRVYLDLGEMYNIAEVYINGQPAGVWWQPPFAHDITDLLKNGENRIELKIVNLWPNRLIGDQFLPEEKRFTKSNIKKFTKTHPLWPSGLVGPVNIRIYSRKQ
jgi:hypothetical protein